MKSAASSLAAITQPAPNQLVLSGHWNARSVGAVAVQLPMLRFTRTVSVFADATGIESLDGSGAWLLQSLLIRLQRDGGAPTLQGLRAEYMPVLEAVAQHLADQGPSRTAVQRPQPGLLANVGHAALQ
jgi:ABC-type transporter Mla MlaB component